MAAAPCPPTTVPIRRRAATAAVARHPRRSNLTVRAGCGGGSADASEPLHVYLGAATVQAVQAAWPLVENLVDAVRRKHQAYWCTCARAHVHWSKLGRLAGRKRRRGSG